jgi:hypothetical protein
MAVKFLSSKTQITYHKFFLNRSYFAAPGVNVLKLSTSSLTVGQNELQKGKDHYG